MRTIASYFLITLVLTLGCATEVPTPVAPGATLDRYLAQYAPYEMSFDASAFAEKDKQLLRKLIEAARYLDTAYWMQTSVHGLRLRDSLAALPADSLRTKLLTLLNRNAGPFDLLRHDSTFIGTERHSPGQEIYPQGMTAEMFDAWYGKLSPGEQAAAMSPYSVIREDGSGGYKAVPYNVEYSRWVEPMARLLGEAAAISDNESFSRFLRLKAKALLEDRYFDADTAWIELGGNRFDIVFGPFEVYSDGIKGVKAKYEANIEVVDQEESRRLDLYRKYLNEMEQNLPVGKEYKSRIEGLTAQFVIVTDIMRAGESAAGYQAVATNLPNDPEVHQKKGSKKTFWKNMFKARFNTIIKPVSIRLIHPEQLRFLSDEGFFQFVLMHEICHALGPRVVKTGPNKGLPVNNAIGPEYNALEEAKADIAGLHSLIYLMDKKVIDRKREKEYFVSYLGSLFRSVRFGLGEAHGKAAAISLNYLVTNGGILYEASTKRWSVDFPNFRGGVEKLARELVMLEGDGDPARVKEFFGKWITMTDPLSKSLAAVSDIAIDVIPKYSIRWE
ncbi:MAG TPA: hypothetical protein VI932_01960 [Bacteroidota bacterium]|nr:hypothetical protein [Bacteroidota bacterium]